MSVTEITNTKDLSQPKSHHRIDDAGVQQECQPADAAVNTSFSEHSYSTTESPRKLKRRLDETDY